MNHILQFHECWRLTKYKNFMLFSDDTARKFGGLFYTLTHRLHMECEHIRWKHDSFSTFAKQILHCMFSGAIRNTYKWPNFYLTFTCTEIWINSTLPTKFYVLTGIFVICSFWFRKWGLGFPHFLCSMLSNLLIWTKHFHYHGCQIGQKPSKQINKCAFNLRWK